LVDSLVSKDWDVHLQFCPFAYMHIQSVASFSRGIFKPYHMALSKDSREKRGTTGNRQGTTQTGGQNNGGQRRNEGRTDDTSRTSSQGRKEASGGGKERGKGR
jgi:hypothetical protein